jgi:anti-sigma factor RsiW
MCPDRQILSVYFDGELDSPWREKLEKHLEDCPQCREQLESYRFIRQKLCMPSVYPERSIEKVWAKTQPLGFTHKRRAGRFWAGSVSVPLPLAAAAGLVIVLTLAALITRQPVRISDPQLAGLEVQDMTPVSDMASFFQYLGSENSPDMVIIQLPNTTFKNAGEPQMLRAADYPRSTVSR